RLHEGRLAAAGGTRNNHVAPQLHRTPEELGVAPLCTEGLEFAICVISAAFDAEGGEKPLGLIVVQATHPARWQPDRDRHRAGFTGRRNDELRPLPGREGERYHRL